MKFLAPAKINLHLKILHQRPDGFHEIRSLMRRIDLFDEIEMELAGKGIKLRTTGEETPQGRENLACRAAEEFFTARGKGEGLEISLQKKIPVAAGLGGGSSDAATVLLGLNELLATTWSKEKLMALGTKIGADVPFFILETAALAEGIGEKLTPVTLPDPMWCLLLIPPFRLSTAWSYAAYDRAGDKKRELPLLKKSYAGIQEMVPFMYNDLEAVALARYPEIGRLKKELLHAGAQGALMTGSGPVIFGLFPAREKAEQGEKNIPLPAGWKTVICRGI